MREAMQTIFGLLGGLAVFIYGMNMMSECLQKAAGEKMKTILGVLTKNPVMYYDYGMKQSSGISCEAWHQNFSPVSQIAYQANTTRRK